MTTLVFVGPTLPRSEVLDALPDAVVCAPAQAGDVYLAVARHRASTIALVDGVFGQVPSVWHKEILFALDSGVRVLGASSMGALRAVECAPFGMTGIGWVVERYRSGDLVDDDEVALAHLDEDAGFRGLTVPMVNLRYGSECLVAEGRLDRSTATEFLRLAKDCFYADRTWDRLAALAATAGPADGEGLVARLRDPRFDVKARDARELLQHVAGLPQAAAPAVGFEFEDTVFWRRLVDEVEYPARPTAAGWISPQSPDVLRHLLLEPFDPRTGLEARLFVVLVERVCRVLGFVPSAAEVQACAERRRRDLGLLDAGSTRRWLDERGITVGEWRRALTLELMVDSLVREFGAELRATLPRLVARHGGWSAFPSLDARWTVSPDDEWAAVARLVREGRVPPADTAEALAARLGFTSLGEFVRAAARRPAGPPDGIAADAPDQ